MNRFWLFLRDEQTREERTAHRDILHQYRGAGTGLILSSLVLSHLLATLGVLVHASQNAPAWLAVVAPDALELAVTLGTRSISRGGEDEDEEESRGAARTRTRVSLRLRAGQQMKKRKKMGAPGGCGVACRVCQREWLHTSLRRGAASGNSPRQWSHCRGAAMGRCVAKE
jgi:hypothetical protein